MNKVILFNPRSANAKHRIPNSILQVGASIHGKYPYVFVDGNMETDPWAKIKGYLDSGEYGYLGVTVMPGPQLKQAIPFSKQAKEQYPSLKVIWGGYFAGNQHKTVITSGYVDYIIDGPGDHAFPELLDKLEAGQKVSDIKNLIYLKDNQPLKNPRESLFDQNSLPELPYAYLNEHYALKNYLGKTFLGKRTASYHSSMGCPFECSFCAVVPLYNGKWRGKSAENIYKDIRFLKDNYGADSIEFHDNNFFVNQRRTVDFSKLVMDDHMNWWGEGRIDTIDQYSDESLKIMSDAGCRMIFFGAETGNDDILSQMNKGGKQTADQIKRFAARMAKFDIIPEYSFVLGMPADNSRQVMKQIKDDIAFIKEIKRINPATEIIIYIYSPVATEGSELYEAVKANGFQFPEKLEDWLEPQWKNFDLRKNPLTPWLTPKMVDTIQDFETVLNAYYPTASDFKVSGFQRKVMRSLSSLRYHNNWFTMPYELKFLQKYWMKYRQPEITGFYME